MSIDQRINGRTWQITCNGFVLDHLFNENGEETFDPTEAVEVAADGDVRNIEAGDSLAYELVSDDRKYEPNPEPNTYPVDHVAFVGDDPPCEMRAFLDRIISPGAIEWVFKGGQNVLIPLHRIKSISTFQEEQ